MSTQYTLMRSIQCTGIHGQTGRPCETGLLEAGALVRSVRGYPGSWHFEASTDGGRTWYKQRSTERPQCARVIPVAAEGLKP